MRFRHIFDQKKQKKYIEAELKAHLHQAKTELVKKGYTEDEAEELAVRNMGSPSDIGLKMDKLHRPKIDWKLMSMFLFMSAAGLFLFWFLFKDGNSFSVLKQVCSVTGSVILACVLLFFDYRKLQRWGWAFFTVGCLILVQFHYSNVSVNGSPRINIMGLLSVDSIVVLPLFSACLGRNAAIKKDECLFGCHFIHLFYLFVYGYSKLAGGGALFIDGRCHGLEERPK
ncbi:permease prefix domain 1-containing protein [Peribacillus frigoritolerans]|nr:permease prefix domain 1-containing protein [Peribacillus frigoritolerans]